LTVLASRDFAPWLQDSGFFHALFEAAGLGSVQDNGSSVKVVGGAVDAIPDPTDFGEPRSGFSLLIGAAHGVTWKGTPSQGIEEADLAASEDVRASLDLSVGALAPDRPAVHVTLPLANTIFSTGKVSTTVAGTWTPGAAAQPWAWAQRPQDSNHGGELTVPISLRPDALGKLAVPLKAITPPRKVVSGLGNIVREVEVDGKTCSASAELEAVIPRLLAETHIQGPMPVWALVMSEASIQRSGALKIAQSQESEAKRNEAFTALVAAGCRFHKICEFCRWLAQIEEIVLIYAYSKWRRRMGAKERSAVARPTDFIQIGWRRGRAGLHQCLQGRDKRNLRGEAGRVRAILCGRAHRC
jgi:hypothetical protein